jgi:hypothetical protein
MKSTVRYHTGTVPVTAVPEMGHNVLYFLLLMARSGLR